jgi:ferredoxin
VDDETIAKSVGVGGSTVYRTKRRFVEGNLEAALNEEPRPGGETNCRNGVCGSCLTRVIEGRPDHRDMVLTAVEKAENNRIAVCCSRSKSRVIVLDI